MTETVARSGETDRAVGAVGAVGPLTIALILGVLFFGGFAAWSMLAPLESAAVVPGIVVVDSNRKAVQHLEGGVVAQLFAAEGEEVRAGQVLVLLDQTAARSAVERLRSQLLASLALQARLKAERDEAPSIELPPELAGNVDDPAAMDAVQAEFRVFEARRAQMRSQVRILQQRSNQVNEEIRGLTDLIKAQDRQLRLIREEATGVEALVEKGLERKARLLNLQRQAAEIEGQRAQNVANIARGQQSIGENEMRALDLKAQLLSDAAQKLRNEEASIFDTREKIRTAEDVLRRTEIRAPVSGRVQALKVFTIGGVVPPRETIMEIVPGQEKLIVEAQMATNDIDSVRAGLPVQLRFTAFNQRRIPTIDGSVLTVSGDRMNDLRTGAAFYQLRIAINDDAMLPDGQKLYPGMPVEAMVKTGSQTLFGYLTRPIADSMNRALREN